jgi:mRNA interferase RelE/StbE
MTASVPPQFTVRLRGRRVQRELDALRASDYRRVLAALQSLAQEPRPRRCEKLYDSVYRVRVGDWRIVYLVDGSNRRVEVGGIRRRNERTYQGIEDLFT